MAAFVITAVALLWAAVPLGFLVWRGGLMEAVVAYELTSSIAVIVLVVLAQGFNRSGEFELAILLAVLLLGSGLVFVRALERWL